DVPATPQSPGSRGVRPLARRRAAARSSPARAATPVRHGRRVAAGGVTRPDKAPRLCSALDYEIGGARSASPPTPLTALRVTVPLSPKPAIALRATCWAI